MKTFAMDVVIRVNVAAEDEVEAHAIVNDSDYTIAHDQIKSTEMREANCVGTVDEHGIVTPIPLTEQEKLEDRFFGDENRHFGDDENQQYADDHDTANKLD